jgi:hypothetical protein
MVLKVFSSILLISETVTTTTFYHTWEIMSSAFTLILAKKSLDFYK